MHYYCQALIDEKEKKVLHVILSPKPLRGVKVSINLSGNQMIEDGQWSSTNFEIDSPHPLRGKYLLQHLVVDDEGNLQSSSALSHCQIVFNTHKMLERPAESIPMKRIV